MPFKRIQLILAFIFSFSLGGMVNFYNTYTIRQLNPENINSNARSLKYGKSIESIDDYWYVNHIKNYKNKKGFTYSTDSRLDLVRRTPIYPMFYGLHYEFFGEQGSYALIRWTQLFLYALSTIFLLLAAYNFTSNPKIAWLTYFLYLFNLPLTGFVFYTITEALYPSLLCFLLYAVSVFKVKLTHKSIFAVGFLFALCALTRPAIVFILPPILLLIVFYNNSNFKKSITSLIYFGIGAGILFLPWVIRNYIVTKGGIVILEKYYGGDQIGYGMPNMHLKFWIACWENPANFSPEVVSGKLMNSVDFYDSIHTTQLIDSIVNVLPERALIGNSKDKVHHALDALATYYIVSRRSTYTKEIIQQKEQIASNAFLQLKSNFVNNREGKRNLYFYTPIRYLKGLIVQSNASSLAFLDNYSGNPLKIAIKAIFVLINISSFISIFFILFWYKKYKDIFWLAFIFSGLTIFIIMTVNKNFEARYLFPLMPILYMTVAISCVESFSYVRRKLNF